MGTFDQQAVVRMIQDRRSAIQACYERELRGDPTAAGRIAVRMTVEESGATTGVAITSDSVTPPLPALGPCLVRIIDRFEFSPAPIGGSVSYTFPFVFEPQEPPPTPTPTPPPTPDAEAPTPSAPGFLTPDEVRTVVVANRAAVLGCYEQTLQTHPALAGRVEIAWHIALDGAVRTARVARTTMGSIDVEACIAHEILGWQFPAPRGGEVDVVFPFIFGPRAATPPAPDWTPLGEPSGT